MPVMISWPSCEVTYNAPPEKPSPAKKKPAALRLATPIEAMKRKDAGVNISIEELRDFVAGDI